MIVPEYNMWTVVFKQRMAAMCEQVSARPVMQVYCPYSKRCFLKIWEITIILYGEKVLLSGL